MMHAIMVPPNNSAAYAMRDALEFLHDGHAEQHRLHAALPKQHATEDANDPIIQPMFLLPVSYKIIRLKR